jgi:hypothetical protein
MRLEPASDRHFRQDIHPADLGGHPELRAFLHAHDGGLAANPALLPSRQFRGQDENQLNIGSLLHFGVGVEKHSIGADVAGLSGLFSSLGSADSGGNGGVDSGSGAALVIRCHVEPKLAHILYTKTARAMLESGLRSETRISDRD